MEQEKIEKWFSTLTDTLAGYDYWLDYNTITDRTESYSGLAEQWDLSEMTEDGLQALFQRNQNTVRLIPKLLAIRESSVQLRNGETYDFETFNKTPSQYVDLVVQTGLLAKLQELRRLKVPLAGYLFGIDTGLNANSRKNRGGLLMESLVEEVLKETGCLYKKQITCQQIEKLWKVDLSGMGTKRFDFAIETKQGMLILLECNFYRTSGSKQYGLLHSYQRTYDIIQPIDNVDFFWVTDGKRWLTLHKALSAWMKDKDCICNLHTFKQTLVNLICVSNS